MKIFILFVALFVIVLSVVPCNDYVAKAVGTEMISELTADPHSEIQCSPLCACQCCQAQITKFEEIPLLKKPKPDMRLAYFSYKNHIGQEIPDNLFQPPKVEYDLEGLLLTF